METAVFRARRETLTTIPRGTLVRRLDAWVWARGNLSWATADYASLFSDYRAENKRFSSQRKLNFRHSPGTTMPGPGTGTRYTGRNPGGRPAWRARDPSCSCERA